MDESATRHNLSRYIIVFCVCAVLIVFSVVFLASLPRQSIEQNPEQFLPANTIFFADVPLQQLRGLKNSLLVKQPNANEWIKTVQSFWSGLEATFSVQSDRVIWFLTRGSDGLHQGILFHAQVSIPKKQIALFSSATFPDLNWYRDTREPLRFIDLGSSIYALYQGSLEPQGVLTSFDVSDVVFFADPVFQQELSSLDLDAIAPISEFMPHGGQVSFAIDANHGIVRFHLKQRSYSNTSSTDIVADLPILRNFDVAISGDLGAILDRTATSTMMHASILNLAHSIANTYSIDPEIVVDRMRAMQGVVVSGDQWLVASDDQKAAADLGSDLTAWFKPRTVYRTLPDGTPYRELMKDSNFVSSDHMINGSLVSVWSHSTSSDTFIEPGALYRFVKEGKNYLTNSLALVREYIPGTANTILKDALVLSCSSGLPYLMPTIQTAGILHKLKTALSGADQTIVIVDTRQSTDDIESVCIK